MATTEEHFDYDFDLISGSFVRRFYYFEPASVFEEEEGGEEQYYNYKKIYEKAKELFVDNPEKLELIEKNFKYFEERNRRRNRRMVILREALERHGLVLRKDSWLSKQYILYRAFPVRDVVFTMHKMDVLHKKCGIREKWENEKEKFIKDNRSSSRGLVSRNEYKERRKGGKRQEVGKPEMSMWAVKDLFYDKEYMNYVKNNASDRFQWVAPSYSELEKNKFDYNAEEEENGMVETAFNDDMDDIKTI